MRLRPYPRPRERVDPALGHVPCSSIPTSRTGRCGTTVRTCGDNTTPAGKASPGMTVVRRLCAGSWFDHQSATRSDLLLFISPPSLCQCRGSVEKGTLPKKCLPDAVREDLARPCPNGSAAGQPTP